MNDTKLFFLKLVNQTNPFVAEQTPILYQWFDLCQKSSNFATHSSLLNVEM